MGISPLNVFRFSEPHELEDISVGNKSRNLDIGAISRHCQF
jgi:hypothetical protein